MFSKLHAFIKSHGFNSWNANGYIEIAIPCVDSDGTLSKEIIRCLPTASNVYTALGY